MHPDPVRIAVIGTGYVGLVTGSCLAQVGHRVTCIDLDPARIETLHAGRIPIFEPGLDQVVAESTSAGRLDFTTEGDAAVASADVILIAVGTPQGDDGSADLSMLERAAADVIAKAAHDAVVVIRSTVPPGTGDRIQAMADAAGRSDVHIVNAPEFLAEGTAVRDFQEPDRLVFGGSDEATARVAALWDPIRPEAPRIRTDRPTAELTKYAANTFLAARVSLINEVANLADAIGADVRVLAQGIGLDSRIGAKFLRAGIGYGGSCFPKDVQALAAVARSAGVAVPVAEAIEVTNAAQWQRVVARIETILGDLSGKRIAIWGIAFKPGTDDIREAPAPKIAAALAGRAEVVMHDPVAKLPEALGAAGVRQVDDLIQCVRDADILLHATEWPEYAAVDPAHVAPAMRGPHVIDGRNTLDMEAWAASGLDITGIGARPAPLPEVPA